MFELACITGATSGIGEALAEYFAKKGMELILTGRSQERLQRFKEKWGPQVTCLPLDLAEQKARKQLLAEIHQRTPDLIVNNAGLGLYGEALTYATKDQMQILEVNANACLEISLEGARTLISNGKKGVIVNISSAGDAFAFPCFSVYAASKAFVTSFSQSFDDEIQHYGVRCLVACPGMVQTDFGKRASGGKYRKPSPFSMPVKEAVEEIWWQIKKQKPLHVFNWRFRLATTLGKMLMPKKNLMKKLRHTIEKRIERRTFIPIEKR